MANMSYCRFQNTLADLRDCEEALAEAGGLDGLEEEDVSAEELKAAKKLVALCLRIADLYEDEEEG